MSKLIYIDSFCYGHLHEDFNASSLLMFCKLYDSVEYYATSSSMEAVSSILKGLPENVTWHKIYEIKDGGHLRNALRHTFSAFVNNLIILKSNKKDVVYINFNSIWGLKCLARLCEFRKINIIQQCHGELEYLCDDKGKLNKISAKGLSLIKDGYFSKFKFLHFTVLGDSILSNVNELVNTEMQNRFLSFMHSFVKNTDDIHPIDDIVNDPRIKLAIIGNADVSKGLNEFLSISQNADKSKFRFFSLGRADKVASILKKYGIEYISGSEQGFVPKHIMCEYMKSMDAILFFYPFDSYKLTASGALFNAIEIEKPIFSYSNCYFEPFFKRNQIGRLFTSTAEMAEFINSLDRNTLKEYSYQNVINEYNPEKEAERLRPVLEKLNLLI